MFERLKKSLGMVTPQPPEVRIPIPNFVNYPEQAQILAATHEKDFDWLHYQTISSGGMNSMFFGEFNLLPTIRVMKQLHIQEFWVNACTNAIARQFLNIFMQLRLDTGEEDQIVTQHEVLRFLRNAGREVENSSYMNFNTAADIMLTGNAYWYVSKDLSTRRRLPAERVDVVVKSNQVVSYRILNRSELSNLPDNVGLELNPEEIIHFKYPNPFSPVIGLSPFIASILPTLIDKYGREFIIGFFLRGGNTAGIVETDTTNMDQLMKLSKSIMQAFGGRRNMHSDKILPKGATWKGQGTNFADIKLFDLLKENVSLFKAASGNNNTSLGLGDQSNRATAFAEMEFFWRNTIEPLQFMFCEAISSSSLWKRYGLDEKWSLEFDNSHIPYLDDFDRRLDQDTKLIGTLTVNERRERLGYDEKEGYDVLQGQISNPNAPAYLAGPAGEKKDAEIIAAPVLVDPVTSWKAEELNIQEPSTKIRGLYQKEFGAWEAIILDNLQDKKAAVKKVNGRGEAFAKSFADKTIDGAMRAYDNQIKQIKIFKSLRLKESDQDRQAKLDLLKERAKDIVKLKILERQKDRFLGYTKTAMDRIYDFITAELEAGKATADVAASVRMKFNESYGLEEAYQGQAETIVRTEYSSAVAIGQAQFGEDLSTVTTRMAKYWVSMDDKFVRYSHVAADDESPIEDESAAVVDALFSNGLKYPKDPNGPPEEIINCRCVVRYVPVQWKD